MLRIERYEWKKFDANGAKSQKHQIKSAPTLIFFSLHQIKPAPNLEHYWLRQKFNFFPAPN